MEREILFRGFHKQADGPDAALIDGVIERGRWVEGDLRQDRDLGRKYISGWNYYAGESGVEREPFEYEIVPVTAGQYTGLTDKNGKKIFVGDTVRVIYDGNESFYKVVFDLEELDFKATNGEENYGKNFQYMPCCEEIEVTGTIYDPPEGDPHEPV